MQQAETITDKTVIRFINKGEGFDLAQPQIQHLQNHRGKIGTTDLRVGKFRTANKILFTVQTDTATFRDTATAAFTLVGTGLRNRFYRQALHFGTVAVTADTGGARVNHITDTGHGQGGFRDIG